MRHSSDTAAWTARDAVPGVGAYEWRIAEDQLIWSPSLVEIYGLDRAPGGEDGFIGLVHPEDRTRVEAETSAFLDGGDFYEHEFRILRPDGEVRWVHDRGSIERSASGSALAMRGINVDVSRHRLPSLDDRARLAHLAAAVGIYDLDVRAGWSRWSPELLRLVDPDNTRGGLPFGEIAATIHPDDRAAAAAAMERALHAPGRFELSYRLMTPEGDARWMLDRGESFGPVDSLTGRVERVVGVLLDVTDSREAADRAEMMMREVSHRSKNLMALVQAVARQTARSGAPEDFLSRFETRLQAMASAHDLLVNDGWRGISLEELARGQLAHFGDLVDDRILLRGPPLRISADAAQTLGMAIHELATNAGKYGALSNDRGRVRLSWDVRGGRDGGFRMAWVERGGPPVSQPPRPGFGTRVVEQMVRRTLEAEVRLDYRPQGVTWRMRCARGVLGDGV